MSENNRYKSNNVFKKAIFNIAFQIIPILLALILTPFLINGMGKDFWAKYSTGISLIFLSNYFSFGIGPALNRRVSEVIGLKKYDKILYELKECVSFSYFLGIVFFIILQIVLLLAYKLGNFSILKTGSDFSFYQITIFNFFLVFIIIPYRSILESFSDFYFLAIVRAITAAMLFLIPFIYILLFGVSLKGIAMMLSVFYCMLYSVYYFRVFQFKNKFHFKLPSPIGKEFLVRIFKFDLSFLKETFYFSLFFLTSAIVLFFDRFYYAVFFNTIIISDQVTMLDLFNRVAIITGTISIVYFSAISVWYQEKNLEKIRKNLQTQIIGVFCIFFIVVIFSYFFLNSILGWWLGESFSLFIEKNSFSLLFATILTNFVILLVRPLQAIGLIKVVSLFLVFTTIIYICIVIFLGYLKEIEYHYLALITKSALDIIILISLLKKKRIL
ncbi:hypothetical protein ACFSTE_05640 [Aquimarina hainanensis]|uniref:Polysaccharide biosynthesis protein C-terminal domain-containing protein n=1 Tax=Aquimarina hainanensis TaxID=1578017 RepID=A0ABW5N464_9FLAO